ncbi:MAG: hypothetical protein HC811_13555 [Flammeovirgaceae bacterium]|nr:hypothetical protein [Flammeovirgaceae bacterium]
MTYKRKLMYYDKQTQFSSIESLANPISSFEIEAGPADLILWDITDPFNAKAQTYSVSTSLKFSTQTASLSYFQMARLKDVPYPILKGSVENQNIHGASIPDLIIVTHPSFKDDAIRLANHRQSYNNFNVLVATTTQIYNEFSGGRQDVTAIRDLARYFIKWKTH